MTKARKGFCIPCPDVLHILPEGVIGKLWWQRSHAVFKVSLVLSWERQSFCIIMEQEQPKSFFIWTHDVGAWICSSGLKFHYVSSHWNSKNVIKLNLGKTTPVRFAATVNVNQTFSSAKLRMLPECWVDQKLWSQTWWPPLLCGSFDLIVGSSCLFQYLSNCLCLCELAAKWTVQDALW